MSPITDGKNALLALYAAIDAGDVTRVVAAFTANAVWETTVGRAEGRDEIQRFFSERFAVRTNQTLHVLVNPRVTHEGDAIAIDGTLMLYVSEVGDDAAMSLLRTVPATHRLRRVDGRWLVSDRRTPDGVDR